MTLENVVETRNRRLYATRAAAQIGLMSRKTGVSADQVSWGLMSTLPAWCLSEKKDRQEVQRLCGLIYFAPLIRSSVDGIMLRTLRKFVGEKLFQFTRESNQFNHEASGELLSDTLELQVMASGSSILLATLDDQTLVRLYADAVGPPGNSVSNELAQEIYSAALFFS